MTAEFCSSPLLKKKSESCLKLACDSTFSPYDLQSLRFTSQVNFTSKGTKRSWQRNDDKPCIVLAVWEVTFFRKLDLHSWFSCVSFRPFAWTWVSFWPFLCGTGHHFNQIWWVFHRIRGFPASVLLQTSCNTSGLQGVRGKGQNAETLIRTQVQRILQSFLLTQTLDWFQLRTFSSARITQGLSDSASDYS